MQSKATQPVAQYVAELKQCATNCEFGTKLDTSLRDRFVSGIRNKACQRRLLSENDLMFAKVFEIAPNMETADRDACQLRGMESETGGAASFHEVKLQRARNCYRCNRKITMQMSAILKRLNNITVERMDTLKRHVVLR